MLKKWLLVLVIMFMMIIPINTFAEETTQIKEEETPLVGKEEKDYSLYFMGFGVLLVVSIAILHKNKQANLKLVLDEVEDNHDGSYIVHLGYINNSNHLIKFNDGDTGLRVLKGNAILLKRDTYNEFEIGNKKDAVIAVMNKDSEIEFYAGKEHIIIKGSEL